jgi:AraC-like DNA-binding protein
MRDMRMLTFAPSPAVAAFVKGFTIVEAEQEATRTLFPETGVVLGVRYGGFARELGERGATRLPDASLTGMLGAARRISTSAGGGIVLATFHEGGAAALFSEPLHEIFGATIPLDELLPASELERLASQLACATGHAARVALLERLLLARRKPRHTDPLVAAAARAIRDARGGVHVGALARELAISRDRLEKRFRHAVGTTPKHLASIHRLRRAVELYRGQASLGHVRRQVAPHPGPLTGNLIHAGNLARVALDAGYYDQSHFTREFRAFTGESPRRFFASVEHC